MPRSIDHFACSSRPRCDWLATRLVLLLVVLPSGSLGWCAELSEAVRLYHCGRYEQCVQYTADAIAAGRFGETWPIVKIRCELALGRYDEAMATLDAALRRYKTSVRLRWIGDEVCRYNGQSERAAKLLDQINQLVEAAPWRYRDPANQVVLGRFFLRRGADPKQVLDSLYEEAKKQAPRDAEAFLASGQLALEKHDYRLAAEAFQQAAERDPTDPEAQLGLARAYQPSDPSKSRAALAAALKLNPNHAGSLWFVVDNHIDAEQYEDAERVLQRILGINAKHPLAWARRAVLAHLRNDRDGERRCRAEALACWPGNPEVDCLIGRKLSQKYRFAEGAAYQRKALQLDPDCLAAKTQLAQDLLRLGQEAEGWKLVDEVCEKDGYNVVAHNLVTLHDHLKQYRVLAGEGFRVRMQPREAAIYGGRVLQLLERARQQLCKKYGVRIDQPVVVEIFPEQQDFAIRTFGLPGGAGLLGVCFGRVITMNSPASQGPSPSNWQSVLWHEFCHAVTLHKTHNKMPRWLSEGISVYEERQANPAWGQSMTPQYRAMILGGQLTPVSGLSGAFLDPPTPLHLQLAYFQSSLVVEYLVQRYGLETLKRILDDLATGMPINECLGRRAGSLRTLDREFARYARRQAEQLAPGVDWEKVDLPPGAGSSVLAACRAKHPNNYWVLQRLAIQRIAEKQWEAAKEPLRRLVRLYPSDHGPHNAYELLAAVHRELGETAEERAVLQRLAALDDDAVDVYLRLMELWSAEENWQETMGAAERLLAVDPLQRAPHRFMAAAAERAGDDPRAIEALERLALMEPVDPAGVHYRLATLLHRSGDLASARRHILQALEQAPRFREAHRELLAILRQIGDRPPEQASPASAQAPGETPP